MLLKNNNLFSKFILFTNYLIKLLPYAYIDYIDKCHNNNFAIEVLY